MNPGIACAAKLRRYRNVWYATMSLDRFSSPCNRIVCSSPADRPGGVALDPALIYTADRPPPINLTITQFPDVYTNPGQVRTYPWAQVAYNLTQAVVGPKDGLALVPGALPGGWRGEDHATPTLAMCMIVLDFDCGIGADQITLRLDLAGYYCIGHTTHGHLSTVSRSTRGSWEEWQRLHPGGTAADYLVAVKGMRAEIAAGAAFIGCDGQNDRNAVFRHQPCPKYRFYFPFICAWKTGRDTWRDTVLGFAEALAVLGYLDRASAKQQQPFYTPRVDKERLDAFRSFTICGRLITPDDLAGFTTRGKPIDASLKCESERVQARYAAEYPSRACPGDFDFDSWSRLMAHTFQITAALKAAEARSGEPIFSGYFNAGRRHVWCPFEAMHSKESRPEDCFVGDGRPDQRFMVYCQHTHCQGRQPADFLKEWYRQGLLTISEMKDNAPFPFPELADPASGASAQSASSTDSKDVQSRVTVPETFTAAELDQISFGELHWVIQDLLPTGLTLLAGKAKIGKSWLAYNLALAVAVGSTVLGRYKTNKSDVLYLALEDNKRRLKKRMRIILGMEGQAPAGLHLHTEWPRVDDGGLAALDQWLVDHPDVRLVIIDTLGKVRGSPDRDKGIYAQDVADLSAIARLAHARNVALVLVHHTRKADASDVFDMVSGSMGMTATADTNMVLTRARGENSGILALTGRDIENDSDLAMTFDKLAGAWTVLGEARQVVGSLTEQKIRQVLETADEPIARSVVIEATGLTRDAVKCALSRMEKSGLVHRTTRGRYMAGSQGFRRDDGSGAAVNRDGPFT